MEWQAAFLSLFKCSPCLKWRKTEPRTRVIKMRLSRMKNRPKHPEDKA